MRKQSFIKASVILMLSAVAAKGLGALFKIPLTNILGGIGMSYFSSAYSLFMPIYALTVTGLTAAVAGMTAKSAARGEIHNAEKIRHVAMLLFSACGIVGSVAIFLLAKPFCLYFAGSPQAYPAVAAIAPAVFFGCVTAVERGYCEGMSNMYPTAVSQVIEGIVKVAAGLFLCGYVTSHENAMLAMFPEIGDIKAIAAAAGILGVTLSNVGAATYFRIIRLLERDRYDRAARSELRSSRDISRELMRTALPIGVSAVVTNLTALIDMWTIVGCLPKNPALPGEVSAQEYPQFVYGSFAGIALTVFALVPSVTNMLGKSALVCVTRAWESGNKASLNANTSQVLLTTAILAMPSAFGIGALSSEILSVLYPLQPDEAAVCVNALRLLMPGMVLLCFSAPLFSMLQAIGRPSLPLKIMLLGTAVKLGGNLLLIPVMGVDGAAVSTSVSYAVVFAAAFAVYMRVTAVRLSAVPFVKIAFCAALCGISAHLTSDICCRAEVSTFVSLTLSVGIGGAVYIGSLYSLSGAAFLRQRREKHA